MNARTNRKDAIRTSPNWLDALELPMNRKDAVRTSPNWLDALELPADVPPPRTYPAPRVRVARPRSIEVEIDMEDRVSRVPHVVGKNAAEVWGESLPDLAIMTRRRELDARRTGPVEAPARPSSPGETSLARDLRPLRESRSALADATRNAGLLALVIVAIVAFAHLLA